MSANDTTKAIIVYLTKIKKCLAFRVNSGRVLVGGGGKKYAYQGAPTGTSDIIGCLPDGRFLAIEVKQEDKLSEEQIVFINSVIEKGGVAFVAHSVTECMDMLEAAGY